MKKFDYCPVIEIGDIFERIDRNGKIWKAKVINRTEYFVDVEKTQPYQIKVANNDFSGQCGAWHYEDAEPVIERCQLYQKFVDIDDGVEEVTDFLGKRFKKIKTKKVPTASYFILVKETYSAHNKYDTKYELVKYSEEEKAKMRPAQEGFDLFYNYCEEN